MKQVYVVQHVHEHQSGSEDVKFIGVYSSVARARSAVRRLRSKSGFRDCKQGFHLDAYTLDEDQWVEGFADGSS